MGSEVCRSVSELSNSDLVWVGYTNSFPVAVGSDWNALISKVNGVTGQLNWMYSMGPNTTSNSDAFHSEIEANNGDLLVSGHSLPFVCFLF